MDGKITNTAQREKPRALTKMIDSILEIHSFDQQFVIINGLLQPEQMKNIWSPLEFANN